MRRLYNRFSSSGVAHIEPLTFSLLWTGWKPVLPGSWVRQQSEYVYLILRDFFLKFMVLLDKSVPVMILALPACLIRPAESG